MAKLSAAYPWQLVLIGDLVIDCTISETHSFDNEITQYPTESGAVITDNVRLQPMQIDMDCIVSNTPIGEALSLRQAAGFSEIDKMTTTILGALLDIRDRREVVTLRTSTGKHKNMMLKTLNIPRDSKTGDAMRFTASFQQIQVVDNDRSKRVAIPIAGKGGSSSNAPFPGEGPLGRREVATIRLNGRGITVWYDDSIGLWRQQAYKQLNPKTKKYEWIFIRGPLLDGFSGNSTQIVAHRDQAFKTPATRKPLMLDSYPPVDRQFENNAHNVGRYVEPDGKPSFPETRKQADKPVGERNLRAIRDL